MSSLWSNNISISIFGESHGNGIGVVIDNLPSGEPINMDEVLAFMARRAPKKDKSSTQRREKDIPEILSGIYNGRTTGAPLCAMIRNTDQHSKDYENIAKLARPGHADYTGAVRYSGFNDVRGGGHFSGRLTAPLCFAGAIAGQILERRGIYTGAHISKIYKTYDTDFDPIGVSREQILSIRSKDFPTIDNGISQAMLDEIERARLDLDSVGGVVECATINLPAGIGSPMFNGLENSISQLIFGIPAVKGLEFGVGFDCTDLLGSENNDEFYVDDNGHVLTATNNHGGILGGISSGMPVILKVAFKPTSSIGKPQKTIDYGEMKNGILEVKGRHDPCVVPRAVPCVESAVNIAVLSHMVGYPNF